MCLGLVMKVKEIIDNEAVCDYLGNKRKVRIDLIESVAIGDYLLIHAGFAISKLSKEDGEERIELLKQLDDSIKRVKP